VTERSVDQSNSASSALSAQWLPKNYSKSFNNVVPYGGTLLKLFGDTKINCIDQTSLLSNSNSNQSTKNTYPIAIFSHGIAGNRFLYSNICNNIASLGYIVVAIEHRDHSGSLSVYFDEKKGNNEFQEIEYRPEFPFKNEHFLEKHDKNLEIFEKRYKQVLFRVKEVERCLEVLENLNSANGNGTENYFPNPKNPTPVTAFQNKLNLKNINLIGHSFGSTTLFNLILSKHPNFFKKIILTDLWEMPIKVGEIEKFRKFYKNEKILFLNSSFWYSRPWSTKVFSMFDSRSSKSCPLIYSFANTRHQSFSDLPYIMKSSSLLPNWLSRKQYGNDEPEKFSFEFLSIMEKFLKHDGSAETSVEDLIDKPAGLVDNGFSKNLDEIERNYEFMRENNVSV